MIGPRGRPSAARVVLANIKRRVVNGRGRRPACYDVFVGELVRLMTLEGAGILLVLVWLVVRLEWIRSENANAHRAITKNIDDVKQDVRMLVKHLLERKPSGTQT